MPPAERLEVGLAMIVTGSYVVHVGCGLRTPHAVLISGCAYVAIPPENATAKVRPVLRKALPSI